MEIDDALVIEDDDISDDEDDDHEDVSHHIILFLLLFLEIWCLPFSYFIFIIHDSSISVVLGIQSLSIQTDVVLTAISVYIGVCISSIIPNIYSKEIESHNISKQGTIKELIG